VIQIKHYFCLWFDESGEIHERFYDLMTEAWEEARECEVAGYRYHWGDTQGEGDKE